MSAPWKKQKTTLEKVEERFFDVVDQLKLDERAADLKSQIKDLKLDERAADLKEQIAASDTFNGLRDASTQGISDLRSKVSPTPEAAPKSRKRRKVFLLAIIGAGAAVFAYARKGSRSGPQTAPFSPPQPFTPPTQTTKTAGTTNLGGAAAHADKP